MDAVGPPPSSTAVSRTDIEESAWEVKPGDGDDLYSELGLTRRATKDDIESAFISLRYRSARNGPPAGNPGVATSDSNVRAVYAYRVLADPLTRSLYNAFGERGLRMIESRYAIGFAGSLGLHFACLVASLMFTLLAASVFVLQLLIALKVDGTSLSGGRRCSLLCGYAS